MRVVITGAEGLLGWHTHTRLHAANCAAHFDQRSPPFDIVALDHSDFDDDGILETALQGADAVFHFAGVNRAPDDVISASNPAIANRLVTAANNIGATPHILYANSTHSEHETPYGISKRAAGEILGAAFPRFTNILLPHIFGEHARPFYNNVTATLIQNLIEGEKPAINPDGLVYLLHAGTAAQFFIDAFEQSAYGPIKPAARPISVPKLFERLQRFHSDYCANIFPDVSDPFDLALFNSYRAALSPESWSRRIDLKTDARGTLFEAVKGGGGGQTFLSTTKPGVTRGDHFHLEKVERFLVLKGEAIIRIRKVHSEEIVEFRVSGDSPAPVDIPTLHAHSIENIGAEDLLTLFWTHTVFDPNASDTFADKVLQ
ncbi:MAG: UDP-2-acetamido-2,6-beta-L-arabino-hexul-4-ose reductase [Halocynthiibacter sp.]|jgi:UDP-2-acetamido-2,6-beta-L-arabino-hexul-4-ose reductase